MEIHCQYRKGSTDQNQPVLGPSSPLFPEYRNKYEGLYKIQPIYYDADFLKIDNKGKTLRIQFSPNKNDQSSANTIHVLVQLAAS